jgi:hypothetical protein
MSLLFRTADIRDQAPWILGLGNIGSGVTGLMSGNAKVAAYYFVARAQPLDRWWIAFIILGVIIILGPLSTRIALASAISALALWLSFTSYVWRAHTHLIVNGQHLVSLRGVFDVAWLATLHVLLAPYLRRRKAACTTGT